MIAMRLPPRCANLAFAIALTALGAIRAQTPIDLPTAVGGDPVAALRAIGAATSREAARALAAPLRERLDGPSLLALLRFGFGHGDEGVVLGAAVLNGRRFVAVPELARAAAVVVPRTLAPASPLTLDDVHTLVSSRDVAAILTRAASIPDDVARVCGRKWCRGGWRRKAKPAAVGTGPLGEPMARRRSRASWPPGAMVSRTSPSPRC
jgi:hypothetical protein